MQNLHPTGSTDPFTNAHWWQVPDTLSAQPNQYFDYTCTIVADQEDADYWIALTTEGFFKLWVNGTFVHFGPPREAPPYLYYDRIALNVYIKPGINRICIREHYQGVQTQCSDITQPGILIVGRGGTYDLGNPASWLCRRSPGYANNAPRLHTCVGFAENCTLEEAALDQFDQAAPHTGWVHPIKKEPHPRPIRSHLLSRDLPPFSGSTFFAQKAPSTDTHDLWDFKNEIFGFLTIRFISKTAVTIELLHGESLKEDGLPDHQFANGDFREVLHVPKGESEWTSFDKRALRYLAIPKTVEVLAVAVQEWHYPLNPQWEQEAASLSLLDCQLLSAAARTISINCDDLLTDCPRRERAQYSDITAYMNAFPVLFGTWAPVKRWFLQYLRGALPDGTLRMCYPSPEAQTVIPDFSIGFPFRLLEYAEASGDWETAEKCWPSAIGSLQAFRKFEDTTGLLADVPGWLFLCNSPDLNKWPHSSALNALYAAGWNALAVMAAKLGKPDATLYRDKHHALRIKWRTAFLDNGHLRDASSTEKWKSYSLWNYHHSATTGIFTSSKPEKPTALLHCRIRKTAGTNASLLVAASDKIRVWINDRLVLDDRHSNCWTKTPVYHPWRIPLSPETDEIEVKIAFLWNHYEWEIFVGMDTDCELLDAYVGETTVEAPTSADFQTHTMHPIVLPVWTPGEYNQITAGYAIASGMLDPSEACLLLQQCLPAAYHVPWMKRTTPLHATQTNDTELLRQRVIPCNTPMSISLFCAALRDHGMLNDAQALIRQIYAPQLKVGPGTLWEEFAPRSSLCHAWSGFIAPYLLSRALNE